MRCDTVVDTQARAYPYAPRLSVAEARGPVQALPIARGGEDRGGDGAPH
jgi:hypothetical protein